jgi:carbon-monoxide dehydrogenase medium subunit
VKPAPFSYSRPESVAEAIATLAERGQAAKVLAGGQSLLPLLSMRLAAPDHLIDINWLTELSYVTAENGCVRVGALARHADVQRSEAALQAQPLLYKALRFVAHPAIRYRGTTVGSIVHADPAAEMPAVLALLSASVHLVSSTGRRVVRGEDFYLGPLESAVTEEELATEVVFPALPAGTGTGFAEVSRRRGDYAVCGAAAILHVGQDGSITSAKAAYLSVGPRPAVLDLTEAVAGTSADDADFAAAAALARQHLDPASDIHATASYRRQLAAVLTERVLKEAASEARQRQAKAGERT